MPTYCTNKSFFLAGSYLNVWTQTKNRRQFLMGKQEHSTLCKLPCWRSAWQHVHVQWVSELPNCWTANELHIDLERQQFKNWCYLVVEVVEPHNSTGFSICSLFIVFQQPFLIYFKIFLHFPAIYAWSNTFDSVVGKPGFSPTVQCWNEVPGTENCKKC